MISEYTVVTEAFAHACRDWLMGGDAVRGRTVVQLPEVAS